MQIKKQTAFMPLYAPCFLRKTSACAEITTMRSHRRYNPRVLRMTVAELFAAQRRIAPTQEKQLACFS
jgi:hypothetical protein